MSDLILVVDNQALLKGVVESAVQPLPVRAAAVEGVSAAKRRLVQEQPVLIVSMVSFIGDETAGLTFCSELRQHGSFSSIPVILVADSLNDDVIRAGTECGARGIVTWPVSAEALRRRIKPLLPEELQHERPVSTPATAAQRPAPAQAAPEKDLEDKLKAAQLLLARVLHNLKTSDLLQVVEMDDVPRIVFEMCRSVCGFKDEAPRTRPLAARDDEGAEKSGGISSLECDLLVGSRPGMPRKRRTCRDCNN